jgi:hypothetical protein
MGGDAVLVRLEREAPLLNQEASFSGRSFPFRDSAQKRRQRCLNKREYLQTERDKPLEPANWVKFSGQVRGPVTFRGVALGGLGYAYGSR